MSYLFGLRYKIYFFRIQHNKNDIIEQNATNQSINIRETTNKNIFSSYALAKDFKQKSITNSAIHTIKMVREIFIPLLITNP